MVVKRRSLLKSIPAVAMLPHTIYTHAAMRDTKKNRLLVGTGTGGKSSSKGIYVADWDLATGEAGAFELIAELDSPTYFAMNKAQTDLYAISENASLTTAYKLEHGGKVSLQKLNVKDEHGGGPAHVAVNVDGGSVFVANYGNGSLSSYKVLADGSLSDAVSYFKFAPVDGLAIHRHPHIHEVTPTRDGKWLLVNDLGSDRIWIYSIEMATGKLTPGPQAFWQGREKSGPRHLRFHPNGRWVYNVNELDSTVDHLEWDNKAGTLTTLSGNISTLAADFPKGKAFASEIIISADGRFLYVGNRRNETIARLDVDKATGSPTLAQLMAHGGVTARDITLDPTGKYLLVACMDSAAVVVLGIDKKTGVMSAPLHSYKIDSPECLAFTS